MGKISEKAQAVMQRPDENRPSFVVRARQGKNSRFFQTVGYAWRKADKNGNEIISVKLNAMPIETDGSFLLVPPFVPEGETQE